MKTKINLMAFCVVAFVAICISCFGIDFHFSRAGESALLRAVHARQDAVALAKKWEEMKLPAEKWRELKGHNDSEVDTRPDLLVDLATRQFDDKPKVITLPKVVTLDGQDWMLRKPEIEVDGQDVVELPKPDEVRLLPTYIIYAMRSTIWNSGEAADHFADGAIAIREQYSDLERRSPPQQVETHIISSDSARNEVKRMRMGELLGLYSKSTGDAKKASFRAVELADTAKSEYFSAKSAYMELPSKEK
jgi:hypothetical protein